MKREIEFEPQWSRETPKRKINWRLLWECIVFVSGLLVLIALMGLVEGGI